MRQDLRLPTRRSLLVAPDLPLIHRDLSWLQFNDRVLDEARAPENPPLERAKFLAITSTNLDEFFMIRYASIEREAHDARKQGPGRRSRSLAHVRDEILGAGGRFAARQAETFDRLRAELAKRGIRLVLRATQGEPAHDAGRAVFESQVRTSLPMPEPMSADRLAALENLQMGLAAPDGGWYAIPKTLPSAFVHGSFVFFLDDLLNTFLAQGRGAVFRMTRYGDYTADLTEEDPETIPDVVRKTVGSRERGRPVRLQVLGDLDDKTRQLCFRRFRFLPGQIVPAPRTLCLRGLWTLARSVPPGPPLQHPAFRAYVPTQFEQGEGIFETLKTRDMLLHHPYDFFDAYVKWIEVACRDPKVVQIEQTLYRTEPESPMILALLQAAARKKIRVIIEPRARFDELNNLRLAEQLRAAGVDVRFGFGTLKLHAKVTLVTREEDGAIRRYAHLSTGNYNAVTAREYEDLAIVTADPEIGQDVRHFFDAVVEGRVPSSFRALIAAPTGLRRRLLGLIRSETEAARKGRPARIVAKVNALIDPAMVENLYQASNAGVKVDLIVRGACSLIPGVPGLSDNIRVCSVVDRYLEHSRIYSFQDAKAIYLSSADWMPRNFFSRLEIAFPVRDARLRRYLEEVVIPVYLADTVKARELTPKGTWRRCNAHASPVRSQFYFQELAERGYRGTPLEGSATIAGAHE